MYLLLAIAFFSDYVIRLDVVNYNIMPIFLFGVISLFFLYIGKCWEKDFLKTFGYVLAGSFILSLGWFILNVMFPERNFLSLLSPEDSTAIWWAFLIPSIILIAYLIIKEIKFTSKIKTFK